MEGYCRGCLREYDDPTELLQYSESNRRLFVYCTGLQVKRNDAFTFQLCKECFLNLKFACKFKKLCRSSDKKFKTYLGLKNEGENIDVSTYLKNIEGTFTLRLPTANKNSSPPYQKNYDDDDNESNCTSIQNFMTDIHDTLQGEDMLQTEAKIIREVIEEEADISDDSLDSHWLQDDQVSMDNDFTMDFNFAGFSTPHASNIERCNTPEKITNNDEDDTCHYIHKDVILKSDKTIMAQSKKNKASLDVINRDVMGNNDIEYDDVSITETNEQKKASNQNDMPLLDDCDISFDGIIDRNESISELEGYQLESVEKSEPISVMVNKVAATKHVIDSPFTNELEFYMNKVELQRVCNNNISENDMSHLESNENTIDSIINETIVNGMKKKSKLPNVVDEYLNNDKLNVETNIEAQAEIELEKYVSKVELKKKISDTSINLTTNVGLCSIDKNLELALKNNDSAEFPLEDLLNSPHASLPSGASTPTINNILFGSLTPKKAECAVPNSSKKSNDTKQTGKDINLLAQKLKIQRLKKSPEKVRKNMFKGSIRSQKDEVKSKAKIQPKKSKGYKDLIKVRDLVKIDKGNETDESDESKTVQESDASELSSDDELKHSINNDKVNSEDEMYVKVLQNTEPDDLDISISNLLDFGDNNSVDLNISITSDFLKDDNREYTYIHGANDSINNFDVDSNNTNDDEDLKDFKDPENLFKMPLPPPDNKYDLEKGVCKICDKIFKNSRALKLHFVRVHKQLLPKSARKVKVTVCTICGKQWKGDLSSFKRHLRSHEKNVESTCEICTLKFETKGRLAQHMRIHANITKPGNLNTKTSEENKTSKKQVEHRKLVCATCGKEFKAVGNYNIHVRRHTNNFKKKCEICQKGFFRIFDYQQHMAKHNNEYPFECQHCPKKYRNRYLLVNHMYGHLGVKALACEHCDQYFGSKQAILLHKKNAVCKRASDVVSVRNKTKKKKTRKSTEKVSDDDDEDEVEPESAEEE